MTWHYGIRKGRLVEVLCMGEGDTYVFLGVCDLPYVLKDIRWVIGDLLHYRGR